MKLIRSRRRRRDHLLGVAPPAARSLDPRDGCSSDGPLGADFRPGEVHRDTGIHATSGRWLQGFSGLNEFLETLRLKEVVVSALGKADARCSQVTPATARQAMSAKRFLGLHPKD